MKTLKGKAIKVAAMDPYTRMLMSALAGGSVTGLTEYFKKEEDVSPEAKNKLMAEILKGMAFGGGISGVGSMIGV